MQTVSRTIHKALTDVRPLPIVYTVGDLDSLPDNESEKHEIIGGKLFVSKAPHLNHQLIVTNLIVEFGVYLKSDPIGMVLAGPGVIFNEFDAVIPDVIFSTNENIKKNVTFGGKYPGKFVAAPDLVIEVLSFGKKDIERDRIEKREVYSKYKVNEYWIINSLYNSIEIYHLQKGGLELIETAHLENEISSPLLPGFRLKVSEVFKFI